MKLVKGYVVKMIRCIAIDKQMPTFSNRLTSYGSIEAEVDILQKATSDGKGKRHEIMPCDQIPIPCCTIDDSGFMLDYNELFASLFGYSRQELFEVSFLDIADAAPRNFVHKALAKISGQVGIFSQRVWLNRKDGSTFPAILNVRRLRDKQGNLAGANIVIIDDTFNYRAIEDIEKDKKELKRKELLKNEFVAIASHELRTPIQPILGFAVLAKRGTISQEQAWEGVLAEARRLQQLANDILDVSRIDSDSLRYDYSKVKINELIRHVVESLGTEMSKDVPIMVNHDPAERDLQIDADRSRMTQLMTNVVGNAVKFTQKGQIRVETKATVEKNTLEIKVSDTGEGISADIMPRIFEKFVTKDHGAGDKKGSGLGLYISKAIVNAHNGEITGFNNNEGGATFVIRLPISRNASR
jgi:PAS domain S-box-containing protein